MKIALQHLSLKSPRTGAWTILLGIVFSDDWKDPQDRLLYRITLCLFLSSGLCSLVELILALVASRGLIFQLKPRRLVPHVFLFLVLCLLFQIGSNAAAVRLVYLGQGGKPLMAVTIALWISTGFLASNAYFAYNQYGRVADPHVRWQKRMTKASKVMMCSTPSVKEEGDEESEKNRRDEGAQWMLRYVPFLHTLHNDCLSMY